MYSNVFGGDCVLKRIVFVCMVIGGGVWGTQCDLSVKVCNVFYDSPNDFPSLLQTYGKISGMVFFVSPYSNVYASPTIITTQIESVADDGVVNVFNWEKIIINATNTTVSSLYSGQPLVISGNSNQNPIFLVTVDIFNLYGATINGSYDDGSIYTPLVWHTGRLTGTTLYNVSAETVAIISYAAGTSTTYVDICASGTIYLRQMQLLLDVSVVVFFNEACGTVTYDYCF